MSRGRLILLIVGMGLFGTGACLAAVIAIFLLGGLLAGELSGIYLWPAVIAALCFAVVYWRGWRVREAPMVKRAVALGVTVVLLSHVTLAVVPLLAVQVFEAFAGNFLTMEQLGRELQSMLLVTLLALFSIWLTLPAGFVAALAFEWLEQRLAGSAADQVKTAE